MKTLKDSNQVLMLDESKLDINENNQIDIIDSIDISENFLRNNMPGILNLLLIDRTTSTEKRTNNIIWANNNYLKHGKNTYGAKEQIIPSSITGIMSHIIQPRALKTFEQKKERTKEKAEVFTPFWIVKEQNDKLELNFASDNLETYVDRTWLEVTCGEAPYMVTRYDMETGENINIDSRAGFIDRKLNRINSEVDEVEKWLQLVIRAYKSSYGFEWNGDSLLLARENLLYTFIDYYVYKWNEKPDLEMISQIAEIISFNIFQMDGINYTIPLSGQEEIIEHCQTSLFGDEEIQAEKIVKNGKRVKVMNWDLNKMEFFDRGVN